MTLRRSIHLRAHSWLADFILGMKRPPSSPLAARTSFHNSFGEEESVPRCSKRIKLNDLKKQVASGSSTTASDLEDAIQGAEMLNALVSKRSSKPNIKTKSIKTRKLKPIDVSHPAPTKWREAYDMIKSMRAREMAPVDTTGCQLAQAQETDPVVLIISAFWSLV